MLNWVRLDLVLTLNCTVFCVCLSPSSCLYSVLGGKYCHLHVSNSNCASAGRSSLFILVFLGVHGERHTVISRSSTNEHSGCSINVAPIDSPRSTLIMEINISNIPWQLYDADLQPLVAKRIHDLQPYAPFMLSLNCPRHLGGRNNGSASLVVLDANLGQRLLHGIQREPMKIKLKDQPGHPKKLSFKPSRREPSRGLILKLQHTP